MQQAITAFIGHALGAPAGALRRPGGATVTAEHACQNHNLAEFPTGKVKQMVEGKHVWEISDQS
jgi:hypothetical protein